ncbi:hypothetical protein BKA64DRAFT_739078 [Cadophora sp. MPI-SDFR-AT-0126]|nr:hypothetical protein BKA64DRAFT_739078 [Leotiomycetes sp. MPI-SDFR-AT-0126]
MSPSQGSNTISRTQSPGYQRLPQSPGFQAVNVNGMRVIHKLPDVLLGYWKLSSEVVPEDKHAVFGVTTGHDSFRFEARRLTRYGKSVDGNFPKDSQVLWVDYFNVVFDPHLALLSRSEVREYCQIRPFEQDELKAAQQARDNVARRGVNNGACALVNKGPARSEFGVSSTRHQNKAGAMLKRPRVEDDEVEQQYNQSGVELAQQAETSTSIPQKAQEPVAGDIRSHNGIRYERKRNGPFQGKLVSQARVISIGGEDYVEYRVLMTISHV